MSFGFDCCCGCCGSLAKEWDVNVGNLLTNNIYQTCDIYSGNIAFKLSGNTSPPPPFGTGCSQNGPPIIVQQPSLIIETYTCLGGVNHNFFSSVTIAEACQGFAEASTNCAVGINSPFGVNSFLGIYDKPVNINEIIFTGSPCIPPSFQANGSFLPGVSGGSLITTVPSCSLIVSIWIQQYYKLSFCLQYYGVAMYGKSGLQSSDFLNPITLTQLYKVQNGTIGAMNCVDSYYPTVSLGDAGLPCNGPNWPSSLLAVPVF